ncbi:MAG: isoprenylcysteine carboxylmethyltransferase family protein [Lysobacteraceae bacterium]
MKRTAFLIYGVVSYVIALAVLAYAIGFVGNIGVPKSIDSAPSTAFVPALLINLGLLAVFALQHSIMARPAFKKVWTRFVSPVIERSTYLNFTSAALILLVVYWQPMGGVVWHIESPLGQAVCYALFGLGWVIMTIATFLIDHFDLFGLRQVWLNFVGRPADEPGFVTPSLYRWVRHPLYVGLLLGFWFTPTMTVAHLVFAVMCTAYILIAIQLEERDLKDALPSYADYCKDVPMIIPRPPKRGTPTQEVQA